MKFINPLAASGLDQPIAQARQEITMLTAKEISGFAALLLVGGLFADSALACSFVNAVTATANSVAESGYYWIVSGLLGGVVIWIELYQKRGPFILVLSMGLLIFHPRWTVAPAYGPDCSFQNVEASQIVLAVICLLLGYQAFRTVRARRSARGTA